MPRQYWRRLKKMFGYRLRDIDPEDVFLDSANLPGYDEHHFEGRIERPVSSATFLVLKYFLAIVIIILGARVGVLGIGDGKLYAEQSEKNRLEDTRIFANRGVIYDRHMRELATNAVKEGGADFAGRRYGYKGLAHVTGFLKYPARDKNGFYYDEEYHGRDGVERYYDEVLKGKNGLRLVETDVSGEVVSESVIERPVDGEKLVLSLDAKVTGVLYEAIAAAVLERGFVGGAGVIMDVETGEILALTSYPEYDPNVMSEGSDRQAINSLFASSAKPFLNRVVGGLYTPGSVIKPIVALGALNEDLISPDKRIYSSGQITVPNPYDPSKPSIFKDWKAHGYTDMREALAVSSDVYFYSIGGGYRDQWGLGIEKIDRYLRQFGLTEKTGIDLLGETSGTIPTPEWKRQLTGDIWRLGDTYITSIGQYGTLVTPLETVRAIAAVANGGKIIKPSVILGGVPEPVERTLEFDPGDWEIVREGMRLGVTMGTSVGINVPYIRAAAKTGTAEVGSAKKYVHSWSVGFFPYERPRYAWSIILEKGPAANTMGATSIMRQLFDWMSIYSPEYFEV